MNRSETTQVLMLANALERRTGTAAEVPQATAAAWAGMLTEVTLADALDAVRAHYSTPGYPITVGDVVDYSRRVRAKRHEATPVETLELPEHVDPDNVRAYLEWTRQVRKAIGDGTYTPPARAPRRALRSVPDVAGVLRSGPADRRREVARAEAERRDRINADAERQRTASLTALAAMGDEDAS